MKKNNKIICKTRYFQKLFIAVVILIEKIKEYLQFDATILHFIEIIIYFFISSILYLLRKEYEFLLIISKVHRSMYYSCIDSFIENVVNRRYFKDKNKQNLICVCNKNLRKNYNLNTIDKLKSTFNDNNNFFYDRLIIIKSYRNNEKGAIIIKYTNMFRLFLQLFDINKISKKYYIILEPSWVGYFDIDILCYDTLNFPIFIQASEPRDFNFISNLSTKLIPVNIGANWWVDHRTFKPLKATKEFDLIMVASWRNYKRHYRIFHALSQIKRYGKKLNLIIIGNPVEKNKDNKNNIYNKAKYFGVHKQVELLERKTQQEVNYYFNISKINIIWSRKEGFNKAIIEGLFAGIPCIIRKGFNYGYEYPYINKHTGIFSSEPSLINNIIEMVDNYQNFSPRPWVMEHMSCQKATSILNNTIKEVSEKQGEVWTKDISVKVNRPSLAYWIKNEKQNYQADYKFLRTCLKL